MKEFRFILLKLFVIESNIASRLWVNIVGQDGIRSKLAKSIKIQLTCEARKIAVFEIQRKNGTGKLLHILHDEIIPCNGPSCDVRVASIDHMVGFAQKQGKLMLFGTALDFCCRSF